MFGPDSPVAPQAAISCGTEQRKFATQPEKDFSMDGGDANHGR